jgi:hypothetical protein
MKCFSVSCYAFCSNDFGFSAAEEHKCLNSELWHACAGPLVSLPAVGSRVLYFPQGHAEQVTLLPMDQIPMKLAINIVKLI